MKILIDTDPHDCHFPSERNYGKGALIHCEMCGNYYRLDDNGDWRRCSRRRASRMIRRARLGKENQG